VLNRAALYADELAKAFEALLKSQRVTIRLGVT
jgi:hypothetical protein